MTTDGQTPTCRVIASIALLACSVLLPASARADYDFSLSLGYAHVSLDDAPDPFDSRGGFRIEPRFSFGVSDELPQLRLGVGMGISGFAKTFDEDEDDDFVVIDGEVFFFDEDDEESLTLITPEFQVSWRQRLGEDGRWFIEPGVGVGAVIAEYWVGETFGWWTDTDVSEWDVTFGARPFLRAGYLADRWLVGMEVSYLWGGEMEFTDEVHGDIEELYVGVFFGGRR